MNAKDIDVLKRLTFSKDDDNLKDNIKTLIEIQRNSSISCTQIPFIVHNYMASNHIENYRIIINVFYRAICKHKNICLTKSNDVCFCMDCRSNSYLEY